MIRFYIHVLIRIEHVITRAANGIARIFKSVF